jgi:hypothetical protein
MRRTSAGEINFPHLGHTLSSDASTFSRLILRPRGMIWAFKSRTSRQLQIGETGV